MSILVAGSLHLDVVLTAPHLPHLDETVTGSAVDYVFGGKGGNQAVAAARLGAKVHFAGRAGSDAFGDMIRSELAGAGVNCAQLQQDPGPSGMSAAIVDAQGEYGAVIVSAANLLIEPAQISIPASTRLLLLQNEIPEVVNLALAQRAKSDGVKVWLNGAPARPTSDALLSLVDLLIVNRVEADFYKDTPSSAAVLQTLGADGASYNGTHSPGFYVPVVSTHGAGDMFVGALAARAAAGDQWEDALVTAQAAAALHVSSPLEERRLISHEKVASFRVHHNR